ncbi:MAG: hypothetical protein ABI670_14265 [Chloroflexota bacterium]
MQFDPVQTIEAWGLTVLLYPGVVFAALVVLIGEWLVGTIRPLLAPRLYRGQARLYSLLQPLYTFLKLLGRQEAVRWQRSGDRPVAPSHPGESILGVVGAIAPLLALSLLPTGGNSIERQLGAVGDLLIVLLLLAVQPVANAILKLREGGIEAMNGARALGRLLAGLLPTMLLLAALVEVSGGHSLQLANLTVAPLTAQQTLVRLLAGVALIVALPWWSGLSKEQASGSAGAYAGRLLQSVALAAFWAVVILPAPGALPWAVALFIAATLFAYVAMRTIAERWAPARREGDATNLLWATTLPLAAVALILAFWTGV